MSSPSLPATQKEVHLLARPGAKPITDSILSVKEVPLPSSASSPPPNHVLVKTSFLSLDPSMRPSMDPNTKSYRPPAPLGAFFWAGGIGQVVASNHADFAVGDRVLSSGMGARQYALLDVEAERKAGGYFRKVDPSSSSGITDEREYLGALWGTGLAAYLGLVEVAKVKKGDRVLVSGAAGATGGLVIQIAKAMGASYVVGIAGGEDKKRYVVEEFGADECIDYRAAGSNLRREIAALADRKEGGIDVYFDNVGGDTLDAALLAMNPGGRIACCGAISAYSGNGQGLRNTTAIVSRRLTLQGYIAIPHFWPRETFEGAVGQLAQWVAQGKIRTKFHFYEKVGVQHFREALVALFEGKNQGKMLLQVDSDWHGQGAKL